MPSRPSRARRRDDAAVLAADAVGVPGHRRPRTDSWESAGGDSHRERHICGRRGRHKPAGGRPQWRCGATPRLRAGAVALTHAGRIARVAGGVHHDDGAAQLRVLRAAGQLRVAPAAAAPHLRRRR